MSFESEIALMKIVQNVGLDADYKLENGRDATGHDVIFYDVLSADLDQLFGGELHEALIAQFGIEFFYDAVRPFMPDTGAN